jgi:hypothetical protein
MKKLTTLVAAFFLSLTSLISLSEKVFADVEPPLNNPCHKNGSCPPSLGEHLYQLRIARIEHIAMGVVVVIIVIVVIIVLFKIRKKK